MSTTYHVSRTIAAEPEVIWELLTDAGSYPEWNPSVISLEGEIEEGGRIILVSDVNPKRQFKLDVSDVNPPRHMEWSDGMPLGLFRGVRTFEITPNGDGTSEFAMVEVFSGLLEPMISKAIPDQTDSFQRFADALKTTAESR